MASLHRRSKEIFLAALGHPAAERKAFVEQASGDDAELRADVESLLAAHEDTGSQAPASTPPVHAFSAGEMFAERYRMVARLGRAA